MLQRTIDPMKTPHSAHSYLTSAAVHKVTVTNLDRTILCPPEYFFDSFPQSTIEKLSHSCILNLHPESRKSSGQESHKPGFMRWCCLSTLIICVLVLRRSHQTCFYKGCNQDQEEMLNLHLVPHTHDDVGWTATVSNYYENSVSSIISSTVAALMSNSSYRFTYVEMAYFHKWWNEQSTAMQAKVNELVQSGRLQFALGGWVMADEATVYYGDEIDQLTIGRDFLKRLFGSCGRPRVSWQIDSFGHARDNADLFLQASYDSTFFQRIHYVEKQQRRNNGSLEFLWNPNIETDQLNNNASHLFTHVFYDTYCYAKELCMGLDCGYEAFSDEMPQWKVDLFLETIHLWSRSFRTNHILVPMGCDFAYVDAATNFKIMNNLIDKINGFQLGSRKLNVFYSTPACYTQAVNRYFHAHGKLSTRTGDFFPYADQKSNYWSGFYTSRPALKMFVRQQSNLLTAVEQLNVFTPAHVYSTSIDELRQWVAILQHHDAVSGTEQQHVANDYVNNLHKAGIRCEPFVSAALTKIGSSEQNHTKTWGEWKFCNQLNISLCPETDSTDLDIPTKFSVIVYNTLGWEVDTFWLRVPIYLASISTKVSVTDPAQNDLELISQLIPISERTRSIPERNLIQSNADTELVFSPTLNNQPNRPVQLDKSTANLVAASEDEFHFKLKVEDDRLVLVVSHTRSTKWFEIQIEMLYYNGVTMENQVSGAYVFRPQSKAHSFNRREFWITSDGPCVQEVSGKFDDWATLVARVYSDNQFELEWTVGPIPDNDGTRSREVIVRYSVLDQIRELMSTTQGEFFTDSAGRRLIRRLRNLTNVDQIAANYYPVVNRIMLKGPRENPIQHSEMPALGMAVYTDRAQGGTSLQDGQIELMVHRRLVEDDHLGVEEALLEQGADGQGGCIAVLNISLF
ncbi:hypothetical protein P879_10958 [Paragonimus westermani]|uniref:Alpha-mannosidase n=1 Tax=Paragonimus westermani TaxID=34504 RepID=A0A8T0D5C6_9TREM|nr:hypothetical protein P879_10958 [Paragonimus westermani]